MKYDTIFAKMNTADFEHQINAVVESVMQEIDAQVDNEVKIQYVTHVFAKALDQLAESLNA